MTTTMMSPVRNRARRLKKTKKKNKKNDIKKNQHNSNKTKGGSSRTTTTTTWFCFVLIQLLVILSFCWDCSHATTIVAATAPHNQRGFFSNLFRGGGAAAAAASASSAAGGPMQLFVQTIKEARRHLAAAAVARAVSIVGMYPVDTIKTRMQMEQANPLRLAGLYKGVSGSLLGQVPYGVLTFGSYEMYKKTLLERFPNTKPIFLYAIAAVLGDLTGSGWLCPSEVVKQQMQAGMYTSTKQAVTSIFSKKGLLGFYQGYWGGVARDVPFRVAQLTSYEITKNLYLRAKKKRQERQRTTRTNTRRRDGAATPGEQQPLQLSPVDSAVCGAIAGTFSAAITCPLDRIKTLLMTDSAAYGGTVLSCATKIWQQEGLAGFCAGLVPRVTYIAPSVVIFFIAYEQVQQRLMPKKAED